MAQRLKYTCEYTSGGKGGEFICELGPQRQWEGMDYEAYCVLKFNDGAVQLRNLVMKNWGSAFITAYIVDDDSLFEGKPNPYANLNLHKLVREKKLLTLIPRKQQFSGQQQRTGDIKAMSKVKAYPSKKYSPYIATPDRFYKYLVIHCESFPDGNKAIGLNFVNAFGILPPAASQSMDLAS